MKKTLALHDRMARQASEVDGSRRQAGQWGMLGEPLHLIRKSDAEAAEAAAQRVSTTAAAAGWAEAGRGHVNRKLLVYEDGEGFCVQCRKLERVLSRRDSVARWEDGESENDTETACLRTLHVR